MAKRCPVCRSRQWRREMGTGLIVCSEGHVLQNYRNETNDQTDAPGHALRRLRLKSNRKKKTKLSAADPNLYHGARGTYLYFQCLQVILRKQVAVLVDLWKLPPEFETLCRDIWTFNLASLPELPPAEPYLHATGDSEPAPPDADKSDNEHDDDDTPESDNSDDDDENIPEDDDIEARIRELMHGASDSDDDALDDAADKQEAAADMRERRRKRARAFYHIPAGNIAVLTIACWMLRVPVMYMDFIKLIETCTLPYFDGERYLPESMQKHTASGTASMLSPRFAPRPSLLHTLTSRLAEQLSDDGDIAVPELNGKPLLWRATRALAGSPTLYELAKTIGHACTLPFTLHANITPTLPPGRDADGRLHKSDNVAPELACAAVVIVALKMMYGLDGMERIPREDEDPATGLPVIEDYIQAVKEHELRAKGTQEHLFSASSNASVVEFDHSQVAQYLDFCEKALLDRDASNDAAILATYFPLNEHAYNEGDAGVTREEDEVVREMEAASADETSVLIPGAVVSMYRGVDVTGLMPADYDVVLSAAATWSGFAAADVAVVVERYERRLVRWWRSRRVPGV